ncbi:MAG: hypothetical protein PHY43_01910 [Verrucomicrobiales bacterium]|nr:hypothetical protein [Verrucomicrobiales bacterium]
MLVVTAAVYTALTCIEIEALNSRAGYYLPHNDANESHSKWRWSPDINEEFWKKHHRLEKDGEADQSPLNDTELLQMKQDIQKGQSENQLHELIQTRGLLQYPLCVGVVITCAWVWGKMKRKGGRILVLGSAVCEVIAFGFALYRGYFTSLGW